MKDFIVNFIKNFLFGHFYFSVEPYAIAVCKKEMEAIVSVPVLL